MSDHYEPFLRQLRLDFSHPLPGPVAQQRMTPRPSRNSSGRRNEPAPDARRGGVLILLYPHAGRIYLPLILRPTYSGVHSGQVGLPGGGHEEMDNSMSDTALREAYEEVGVHPGDVTMLGALTQLYISASNYLVHPFIGWTDFRPEFRPDPYEVEKLIQAPLSEFLDPDNHCEEIWQLRGNDVLVPFFDVQDQIIWGATAMILSELLTLPAVQQLSASSS